MSKIVVLLFTLVSFALTSWLAPQAIGWYFDPPVNIGVNCRAAVEWGMARLVIFQAGSIVFGVIFGSLIAAKMARNKSKEITDAVRNSDTPTISRPK